MNNVPKGTALPVCPSRTPLQVRRVELEESSGCSGPRERRARSLAAFGHWNEPFALCLFPGGLSRPPDGLGFLAILSLGRFFVGLAPLHLTEHALALHLPLENLESLIDIVFANKNLQMLSNPVVATVDADF
jgi:hypothetical protein